jgi:organic hydroperoxide reductase OsmC/OhrA
MEPYPHHYAVDVSSQAAGTAVVSIAGVPPLHTAPPVQFGGRGDRWSPETLLVAAAADCFVLTFHAVAQASKLAWTALRCTAQGRVERVDGTTRFTQLALHAHLTVPPATDTARAQRLLEKAEKACLITNSLALTPSLACTVDAVSGEAPAAKTPA